MANDDRSLADRVLLVAPTRRDGDVTRGLLAQAGVQCVVCDDLMEMAGEIRHGAGVLLLTDTSITAPGAEELLTTLKQQEPWSDLPIVMLLQGGIQSPAAARVLSSLNNVTLLERPAPTRTVVSAVQAALRARQRQYQIRDHLEEIRSGEAQMRALQEQFEFSIDASQLGTFHCSMPLGEIFWNDRCKEHFWLPADAKVDFDVFYSILHPDDREPVRQAVDACVYSGKPYNIEYRTVSSRGDIRWIRATGRTYYDASGQPTRFDGTTQDITEARRLAEERQHLLESEQAARREAERASRMKDEFLATLSHELRTPLNAIFGWAQLLKMGHSDPATVAKAVDVIDRNVRVQTQLIEDLLDMSRIISGKVRLDVQSVELTAVIHAALESVKPAIDAKEIRLERIVDPRLGSVSGDFGRLQQVLWNLLTNAVKFTPKGGRIHILAERVNSHVEISVTDTGEGIAPEFLPRLFERFSQADGSTTRQHGGLGLGLSIVKNLVELHGGTIHAQSAGSGQGATFVIRLPQRALKSNSHNSVHPSAAVHSQPLDRELLNLNGIKVLVVDDEKDARELVNRFLVQSDAVPALAASAEEARDLLTSFMPDVILSDIGMPEQDGYEFMRNVRKNGLKTPAIALTAFARPEDRVRSIEAGYQAHLSKPVEPAELLAMIATLFDRSQIG